jgi:hypothetical protein
MPFSKIRTVLLAAGLTLTASACSGAGGAPSSVPAANSDGTGSAAAVASPADTTSILKLLTKDVTIGSTVDPTNGDTGPRADTVLQDSSGKLKKGQLLVCNFEDKSGTAGNGTTIEQFSPTASSKPTTFIQNSKIEGCDGSAESGADGYTYASGFTSKVMASFTDAGQLKKIYGTPITQPLGDGSAPQLSLYSADFIFIGNADTGALDSYSFGSYGSGHVTEIVNGFDVNKGSGWSALGPSGIAYWCGALPGAASCPYKHAADSLFVADGACNAVVEITHASSLLETDEITIEPGCKKFKCEYPKTSCAKLVKAGSPLDKPVAMAVLPNGNLIVANTANNTLVEMTQTGQVLDTKVVDKSKTPGIFGVAANGKDDADTVLFYTDTNTNTLHELEQ